MERGGEFLCVCLTYREAEEAVDRVGLFREVGGENLLRRGVGLGDLARVVVCKEEGVVVDELGGLVLGYTVATAVAAATVGTAAPGRWDRRCHGGKSQGGDDAEAPHGW